MPLVTMVTMPGPGTGPTSTLASLPWLEQAYRPLSATPTTSLLTLVSPLALLSVVMATPPLWLASCRGVLSPPGPGTAQLITGYMGGHVLLMRLGKKSNRDILSPIFH